MEAEEDVTVKKDESKSDAEEATFLLVVEKEWRNGKKHGNHVWP